MGNRASSTKMAMATMAANSQAGGLIEVRPPRHPVIFQMDTVTTASGHMAHAHTSE